jgi:hypothetical protein
MMDRDTAAEMIQAKALGCLDIHEKKELNEYLNKGGDFPWKEYGEFQSLTSLLPAILEIDIPDQKVKDKVAKRIYEAIAELKERRNRERGMDLREQDVIYPETTVLGEQIVSDDLNRESISDKSIEEIPETETPESASEDIPLQANGMLTDELPISDIGFDIKSSVEENIKIPEPEIFEKELLSENILDEDFTNLKTIQTKHEPEEILNTETKPSINDVPLTDQEANLKKTPAPEIKGPIQSKYRTLQEEKSKKRPTEEFTLDKEKLNRKYVEDIPLKKERYIEPEKPIKKSISGLVVDIIIYVLLLAAIAFVYLKLSSDIKKLQNEVDELKKDSVYLTTEYHFNRT